MGSPDEKIHPVATGRAAKTVEQHQEPQDLVFYSGWVSGRPSPSHCRSDSRDEYRQFCPYVQRAWIVLEERGIPYQYKEVNPYKKEAHFLGTYTCIRGSVPRPCLDHSTISSVLLPA